MSKSTLLNQSCVPCQGGQPPLEKSIADKLLMEIDGQWRIIANGHLFKTYNFKDFMGAMTFANKIAELAEKEGHHPNLTITWGSCAVEIWTHKINGLSVSDFILAAKIDAII